MHTETIALPKDVQRQPNWVTTCIHVLALWAIVLVSYSNSYSVPFVYDDYPSLVTSDKFRDLDKVLGDPLSGTRWLVWISFALNYELLGGLIPGGFRFVNVIIHATAASFLYGWLRTTWPPGRAVLALVAASLFAAHPLATQSVTYIIQRLSSLAGMFFILSMWMWALYRSTNRRHLLGLCLVSTLSAMLCKEYTIVIPLVLILSDWTLYRERVRSLFPETGRRIRRLAVEYGLLLATLPLIPVLNFYAQQRERGAETVVESLVAWGEYGDRFVPMSTYLPVQAELIVTTYLRLCLWPVGLSIDPPFPQRYSFAHWQTALSLAFILVSGFGALVIALWCRAWAWRASGFGLLLFYAALGPTSSFIPNASFVQEQRAYLSIAGIMIVLTIVVDRLTRRHRALFAATSLALVISFSTLTYARNRVWQDPVNLFGQAARMAPDFPRPWVNWGVHLARVQRDEEAERVLRRALRYTPREPNAHSALGIIEMKRGSVAAAAEHAKIALEESPVLPTALLLKSMILTQTGDPKAAEQLARKAEEFSLDPSVPPKVLGDALSAQGKYAEAISEYHRSLSYRHSQPEVYENLALTYAQAGQLELAEQSFSRAVELAPRSGLTKYNMAIFEHERGNEARSATLLQQALALEPELAQAWLALGAHHLRRSELAQAAEAFSRAVTISPDVADAWLNLALALDGLDRVDQARQAYDHLLARSPPDLRAAWPLMQLCARGDDLAGAITAGRLAATGPDRTSALPLLAWLLATASDPQLRRPGEAVALAEAAVRETNGTDPRVLRVLAVSYAAAGDAQDAIRVLRGAIDLARQQQNVALVGELEAMLARWTGAGR